MIFSYESFIIRDIPQITLQITDEPPTNCRDKLFKDLPLTYTIKGKFIILRQKNKYITISGFIHDQYTTEYHQLLSIIG